MINLNIDQVTYENVSYEEVMKGIKDLFNKKKDGNLLIDFQEYE